MQDINYEYDGSFDGLLCCVYDCYTRKEKPVSIAVEGSQEATLFASHLVDTNKENANRIYRSLVARRPQAAKVVYHAYLTCMRDKEMKILRFIKRLYCVGGALLNAHSDDAVYPLFTAIRHMNGEVEHLRGFVRFSEFEGILVAEIEPKNRVLPLLRFHFCDRFSGENFIIYDRTYKEMLIHSPKKWEIVPADNFSMARPDEKEAGYRRLWKCFYDTVAIKARENPRCQGTHMPKRYRGTMTEFQNADYFNPSEEAPDEAVQLPSSPAAILEPEKPQALLHSDLA